MIVVSQSRERLCRRPETGIREVLPTIYNRFVRWARRGVWERLFRGLAIRGRSTETQMIDSTHIKSAIVRHRAEEGEQKRAIGRSRGGRNTRIHAIADAKGRLLSILLTGGEATRLSARPTPDPSHEAPAIVSDHLSRRSS